MGKVKNGSVLNNFIPSWDLYSCAIIAFFAFIQALSWSLFPFFIDIYYHLAAMLGYNAAGGYTPCGFWEYAPVGRPHLYPPLLHVVMLLFYKIGLSKLFIARSLSFVIFPLALTAIWRFLRSLFNKRIAFFAVLVSSSLYSFYYMSLITIPATLAVLSGLASFSCVEKNRRVAAVFFLTYSFYLHALMPWLIVLSLLTYGMINRKNFFVYAKTVIVAIALAAPILVNQYQNAAYFSRIDIVQDHRMEINIFLVLFTMVGAVVSVRRRGHFYFLICLFFSFAILIPFHRYRFLSAEGLYGFIPLAAVGLDSFIGRVPVSKKSLAYLVSVVILFAFISPTVYIEDGNVSFRALNSTLVNGVFGMPKKVEGMARSVFFKKFYNKVSDTVKRYSAEDAIIYSNLDYFAGIIGVMTGRATSNAMLSEIRPYRQFDPVEAATIIIWLKDPEYIKDEPVALIEKYGLRKVRDAEIAFIYVNPLPQGKRSVGRALVPNSLLFLFLFVSAGAVIFDLKTGRGLKFLKFR